MSYKIDDTKIVAVRSLVAPMFPPTIELVFHVSDPDNKVLKQLDGLIKSNPLDWNYNITINYENNTVELEAKRVK